MVVREPGTGHRSGTISYWPLRIGADGTKALLLGPYCHSSRSGRTSGIGMALMRTTLAKAAEQGHALGRSWWATRPIMPVLGFMQVPDGQLLLPGTGRSRNACCSWNSGPGRCLRPRGSCLGGKPLFGRRLI
jgi:predicted N-acetyltransferase YhbS